MSQFTPLEAVHSPPYDRKTILLIDDDLDMQRLLTRAVQRSGHHAVCMVDGYEGLRRFAELRPAMVLLDLMLPNLSGFEICRRLRALGATIPILAISTRDLPEDEVHALESGFDLFISKPVRLDDVSRTITQVLDQRAAAGRLAVAL